MPNIDMHYGAIAGALILTSVIAFAVIHYHPPHWLIVTIGAVALGLFAVGTGSKLDVSCNETKGLEMKVAALEKQLTDQKVEIAALRSEISVSSPSPGVDIRRAQ